MKILQLLGFVMCFGVSVMYGSASLPELPESKQEPVESMPDKLNRYKATILRLRKERDEAKSQCEQLQKAALSKHQPVVVRRVFVGSTYNGASHGSTQAIDLPLCSRCDQAYSHATRNRALDASWAEFCRKNKGFK